jgi:hypothetical protein
MQAMVDQLGGAGLEAETEHHLQGFYDSVRVRASEVTTADGKQQVIAELYKKSFKVEFAKQAEALGIVYTPSRSSTSSCAPPTTTPAKPSAADSPTTPYLSSTPPLYAIWMSQETPRIFFRAAP